MRIVVLEWRERHAVLVVVMDTVEVQRPIDAATGGNQAIIPVVVIVSRPHIRLGNERPGAIRHFGIGSAIVDGSRASVDELLDGRHRHASVGDNVRPAMFKAHAFGLIEDFPSHDGGMILERLHHRHEGVRDISPHRDVIGQDVPRAFRDVGAVGTAKHVKGPETEHDADLVRPGAVQDGLHVRDGAGSGTGDGGVRIGARPCRRVGTVGVEPEAHAVTSATMHLTEHAGEVGEIGGAGADVGRKISPCEIGAVQEQALVIEINFVGRLRPKTLAPKKHPQKNNGQPAPASEVILSVHSSI